MTESVLSSLDVLEFWWTAGPAKWFSGGSDFDREIADRFAGLWRDAASGACDPWAETADGALALVLVLDQFSRNLHRGSAEAFSQDGKALAIAQTALGSGFDRAYPFPARSFFYIPFMHSEDMSDQERCVDLFRRAGQRDQYVFALEHMDIVRRFSRFPHRNAVLGRETTPEEAAFLKDGGFSG